METQCCLLTVPVTVSVLLQNLLGALAFGAFSFGTSDVGGQALIDAYPHTPQVSQGTTVVMVCHVSGVPSDTTVTYQWSCPNYGCGARGLQSDGNIVSRIEEGNMIAIDVVNDTDSGNYTCNVRSSGRVLGSATYRINSVTPALVLTGREGIIPPNGFAVNGSKPSISTPFNETRGNYIRCGWLGHQLEWHRSSVTLAMTAGRNEYFFQTAGTAELWQSTQTPGPNEEYGCREMGSTDITNLLGLFFQSNTGMPPGQPAVTVVSILTTSIQLSWTQNINSGRYYVRYERIYLPISVTHRSIRKRFDATNVTIPDLTPGATYKIQVWSSRSTAAPIGPPYEMDVTMKETAPTAPRLLTVVRNTSTSVDLNWVPPRHPNGVIHYEIDYSTNKGFVDSTTINIASNITYHTLSDVPESPRHYLRVVAVNSAGIGRSSSSNIVEVCLGREVDPSPPTEVMVEAINTICNAVVSWTPPTRGALGCSGIVTYTVTVSTSTGVVILRNVTSTNITISLCFCAVTAVSVAAVNFIGSSKPGVWTVSAMTHGEPIDSNGTIVGAFFGGFGLATGIATVVFILVFCNMKRKINKIEKNVNKSPVKPEESQYTEIEVTANPSYQSVEVKLDEQKDVYESMDTY